MVIEFEIEGKELSKGLRYYDSSALLNYFSGAIGTYAFFWHSRLVLLYECQISARDCLDGNPFLTRINTDFCTALNAIFAIKPTNTTPI